MLRLPFAYMIHYRLKAQRPNPYMNLPCKVVFARTGEDAIRKFNKRHRKYEATFAMKM